MSGSYSVQTDPRAKRTYHLAKFRDLVPALSDPSTTVKMTPNTGELGEQQWGLDVGGGRPFTGTRERVSGIGGKQSGYVLFRVEPSTGVLTVLPMSEWYDFKRSAVSITLTLPLSLTLTLTLTLTLARPIGPGCPRGPSGGLAEAGRSSGQPQAAFGAFGAGGAF